MVTRSTTVNDTMYINDEYKCIYVISDGAYGATYRTAWSKVVNIKCTLGWSFYGNNLKNLDVNNSCVTCLENTSFCGWHTSLQKESMSFFAATDIITTVAPSLRKMQRRHNQSLDELLEYHHIYFQYHILPLINLPYQYTKKRISFIENESFFLNNLHKVCPNAKWLTYN